MKSIIIKYSKYILTLLAVAAMAVGLLMPAQIKAADSYNKDKKGSITIWKCRNCGHIVVGTEAPKVCPVCNHPQSFFEVKAENY